MTTANGDFWVGYLLVALALSNIIGPGVGLAMGIWAIWEAESGS